MTIAQADLDAIEKQLGRTPRGILEIVSRCPSGHPNVAKTEPRLDDGTPFPAKFDSIILGVSSSKYDIGLSSFTINDDRKKQVNMVSYFNAGTQWVTQKGNPKKVDPDNACGLNIGVQKGTVQVDDITARSKKCTDAGKPAITQIVDGDQGKVTTAVIGGKADAMAADSPVGLYAVKQTGGQLKAS